MTSAETGCPIRAYSSASPASITLTPHILMKLSGLLDNSRQDPSVNETPDVERAFPLGPLLGSVSILIIQNLNYGVARCHIAITFVEVLPSCFFRPKCFILADPPWGCE